MSSRSTFIRTRHDAASVINAHRGHDRAPHLGCPLCVTPRRQTHALRRTHWSSPRRG